MTNYVGEDSLDKKFIIVGNYIVAVIPIILTPFAKFIYEKIGPSYVWSAEDILWLNDVNLFWNGEKSFDSSELAIDNLINSGRNDNLDPYELIVDAFSRNNEM